MRVIKVWIIPALLGSVLAGAVMSRILGASLTTYFTTEAIMAVVILAMGALLYIWAHVR